MCGEHIEISVEENLWPVKEAYSCDFNFLPCADITFSIKNKIRKE